MTVLFPPIECPKCRYMHFVSVRQGGAIYWYCNSCAAEVRVDKDSVTRPCRQCKVQASMQHDQYLCDDCTYKNNAARAAAQAYTRVWDAQLAARNDERRSN